MEDERGHLAHEFSKLKRDAEERWDAEQQENTALRERINDVAVEVARLASTLETSSSPIQALLAAGSTQRPTGYAPEDDLAERMRALKSLASQGQRGNLKASN
jgi:hypothetical protein